MLTNIIVPKLTLQYDVNLTDIHDVRLRFQSEPNRKTGTL